MEKIREPAVSGMFYPADARQLTLMVAGFLADAKANGETVKAIIAPHAGYVYSGPIAASAYARLSDCAGTVIQPLKETRHGYTRTCRNRTATRQA